MTRTERAQNPAAIQKDRHSRSGLTKTELSHKKGGGPHNWGSDRTKGQDEILGSEDASGEMFQLDEDQVSEQGNKVQNGGNDQVNDVEGNILRSPTESTSSLDKESHKERPQIGVQRRMSSYSEEERKEALQYRGGWNKGGVDLAQIARTSYGIAQSPPANQYIGTSPTKVKSGFNFNK